MAEEELLYLQRGFKSLGFVGAQIEKPATLRGVQALRGMAACMVVVHHATESWASTVGDGVHPGAWLNGASGVDVFFVISGLVMAVSTIGREDKTHPAWHFLERRLIRIVPLYWTMTFALLFMEEIARWHHLLLNVPRPSLGAIMASLSFIPYKNAYGTVQPIVITGWTLSYEMFFYCLFALVLSLRASVVRVLTPVMLLLVVAGTFHRDNWPTVSVLLSPLLLEFLAGLLLAHFSNKVSRLNLTACVLTGVASLAALLSVSLASFSFARVVQWGIPAVLLVMCVMRVEGQFGTSWPRWALLIGDASYSLYIGHILVLSILMKVLKETHFLTPGIVRRRDEVVTVLILLSGSLVVAILLYQWIEKPITEKLRRLITDNRPPRLQNER